MLELQGISGGYDGLPLLDNINLRFEAGSLVGVIGPIGCGKSTLLRIMARLLQPYSGRLLLGGRDVSGISRLEYARQVSFLPQMRSVPNMTVQALALHGRHPYLSYPRRYRAGDHRAVEQALELTGAARYRHRNVASLSGGERQKAYLAMMVAQDTGLLLMDEPTTYLDIHHQFEILELARSLARQGRLVVMVLHDLNLALQYADQIVVMQNGAVRACQDPEGICRAGLVDEVFEIETQVIAAGRGRQLLFEPRATPRNSRLPP